MMRKIPRRSEADLAREREERETFERLVASLEQELGVPRDHWSLAERVRMAKDDLTRRRDAA